MTIDPGERTPHDIDVALDRLASREDVGSNCMFQLALMLARIAAEPGGEEAYREECAQTLLGLIRAKPTSNVVRLFGDRPKLGAGVSGLRATG